MKKMTQTEYDSYLDNNEGYCANCEEVTAEDILPEAKGDECPECGHYTVYGMEAALMFELVDIGDNEDGDDEEDDDNNFISFSEDDQDDEY